MDLFYVVVPCDSEQALARIRAAVARSWLQPTRSLAGVAPHVRYWVETIQEAENERSALALAGLRSTVEIRESTTWDLKA